MSEQYTYAVARIRALEVSLFSDSTIDQLIACQNYDQALQFLEEKGWGDAESSGDAEKILTREEEKTWEVVKELSIGMEHFDVLSYPKLFHNLKAAVKEVCTGDKNRHIYYEDVRIPGEEMRKIVEDRDFGKLPDSMRIAGEEAYETLLHTGDGQLCDVIIDRAALDAIYQAGKESPDKIIQDYAESTVAVADIKIAVRSQKTAKSTDFMKRAMAECDSLSVSQLSKAALSGMDAICEYLRGTAYAEGADALAESPSAFERWCDNRIIQTISPEKYHANMPWYQEQISNCTYRQFTTGFFYGKPDENTQIYDSNTYVREYTYLGFAEEIDERGLARLTQRNKFSVGETIEIMKPDGRNIPVTVEAIYNEEGESMESAPHAQQRIYVKLNETPEVFDILRRGE